MGAPRLVWSQSSTAAYRLKGILEAMNGLKPDDDRKAAFLSEHEPVLKSLTGTSRHEKLQ